MSNVLFGLGNALVDLEFKVSDHLLSELGISKGMMTLIDTDQYNHYREHLSSIPIAKKSSGGSAANSLVVFSHLGGNSHYSCRLAHDEHGDFYVDDLRKQNVSCFPTQTKEGDTGQCFVLVTSDAERTMMTHLGATSGLCESDVDMEQLIQSQWLFIEGYMTSFDLSMQAAKSAIKQAHEHGVKVALSFCDPAVVRFSHAQITELLHMGVDIVFANEEEICLWSDTTDTVTACRQMAKYAKKVVITMGAKGASVYQKHQDSMLVAVAHEVQVVDSNGSGDAFAGAFLYGVTQNWEDQRCMELANQVAAQVVSQYGARLERKNTQRVLNSFQENDIKV